jgi:hypothetical protein
MNPEEFHLASGIVEHWSLNTIDPNKVLADQVDELKEDLAQVVYPARRTRLDIGWYPEFTPTGRFTVSVIQNDDWDKPLFRDSCESIADLHVLVKRAALIAAEA